MNKSVKFILPLIDYYGKVEGVRYITNTYLYVNTTGDEVFVIKYSSIPLDKMGDILTEDRVLDYYIDEQHLYLHVEIPVGIRESIELFKEGKYSKFSSKNKDIILTFFTKHFPNSINFIKDLKDTLYLGADKRRKLEILFGCSIDADNELLEKINEEEEYLKL